MTNDPQDAALARDRRDVALEQAIGQLLRIGVTLAAVVVLVGGALYLHGVHGPMQDYTHFQDSPLAFHGVSAMLPLLRRGDSRGIIDLGLVVLVATPIARVLFAAAGFLFERDRLYFCVSAFVLAVLVYSLLAH